MRKKVERKNANLLESAWNPADTTIIETDLKPIDTLLGGGIELGTKIMLLGESASGKTTISLQMCERLCSHGYTVLYIDTENTVSESLINNIGLNKYLNNSSKNNGCMFIYKISSYKDVETIIDQYLNDEQIKISAIFIDSFAGLINDCYTEIDNKHQSIVNSNTNFESRPASLFMAKYSALTSRYKVALVMTNQYRMKLDFRNNQSSSKEFGPKAVKYNTDTLIKISQHSYLKDEFKLEFDNSVKLDLKIVKSNKMRPDTVCSCYLEYGNGINEIMLFIEDMLRNNIIEKSGAYYTITIDGNAYKFHGINEMYNFVCSKYEYLNKSFNSEVHEDEFIVENTLGGIDSDYDEDE